MKSTRRHELQTNVLADGIGRLITDAKPRARLIGYATALVVLLLVIFVVVPAIRGRRGAGDMAAASFAVAMASPSETRLRDFVIDFQDAPQVPAATVELADRLFMQAVRLADAQGKPIAKAQADAKLAEARKLYAKVAASYPQNESLADVKLALVTVQEGDLDKGRAALEEVAKKWPDSDAVVVARLHLDRLKGYKPVEFSPEPLESEKKDEPKGEPPAAEKTGPEGAGKAEAAPAAAPPPESPEKQPAGAAPAAPESDGEGGMTP